MGFCGAEVNDDTGGWLTVTVCEDVLVAPRSSVTLRCTLCGPAVENVRDTLVVVPSPKAPSSLRSQASAEIGPSGSVDVDLNVTRWPGVGAVGVNVNDAAGAWSATTSTVPVAVSVVVPLPTVSVTV